MKQVRFLIFFFFFANTIKAQKTVVNEYATIDQKALSIPDSLTRTTDGISSYITANFKSQKEKSRAIFAWVATNIQYDVDNMYAINFYEKKAEKISKPLKTRKGICENYAALFNDICSKSGIKSFVIEGYTKQNGFADYIPHAWCAALVDNSWFLFDPTWGSGFIANDKFTARIDNKYFMVNPAVLIKSHMPFDFLWQFLNNPVTNQEFYEGKTELNKSKLFFNFPDSIQVYETLSRNEQLIASASRIERNGIKNSLIYDRLQHIKLEIENDKIEIKNNEQIRSTNLYNSAIVDLNEGINQCNSFINYRNKQFMPKKTDTEIQSMIDSADNNLKEARIKLKEIKNPDVNTTALIMQFTKSLDEISVQIKEQKDWLVVYFSKGKLIRKTMFYERKPFFGK